MKSYQNLFQQSQQTRVNAKTTHALISRGKKQTKNSTAKSKMQIRQI